MAASEAVRNDWWATASGRATRQWFEAWGATVRERLASGDPTATPAPDCWHDGGNRSGMSNVPEILLKHAEVDGFLGSYATERLKRLMFAVYVAGLEERTERIVYIFDDGTHTEPLRPADPPPACYRRAVPFVRRDLCYDLSSFVAPEIEPVCEMWAIGKERFLERELLRLARTFARVKGL